MVSVAELRRWDPGSVEDMFVTLGEMSSALGRLDEPMAAARTAPGLWQGVAADAARSGHDATAARLGSLRAGVDAARFAIADASDGVAELRSQLADLDARAAATGYVIGADAAVTDIRTAAVTTPTATTSIATAELAERAAAQDRLVDELRQVLMRADDLDAALLAAVSRATAMFADPASAPMTLAGPGATMGIAPPPMDIRTPLPVPDVPGRGYTPSPVFGPMITMPASGGPNILGTPAPPDLGLDRVHSVEPPFPAPREITGRTEHGEQQIHGRDGHGVSDEAVEDAVANPVTPPEFVMDSYGGHYRYQGRYAKVSLNSVGEVVTAWARNQSGWRNP